MLTRTTRRLLVRSAAAAAAAAALTLGGAAPALASISPPDGGGGATDCKPMTYLYASGNTITFEGWTRCDHSTGFELQIAYNMTGGKSHYSKIVTCRGQNGTGSTTAEISCGINGVTDTLADTTSGKQSWCMNTLIQLPTPGSTHEWSTAACISH